MSECGGMSQETFDKNWRAIRVGLHLAISNPKSRRSFRLLELYERDTSQLLAEVFGTLHGPVVIHWSWGTAMSRSRNNTEFRRKSRDGAGVLVAPLTDDPDQRFRIMGGNSQYTVAGKDFRDWIAQGKTRQAIP